MLDRLEDPPDWLRFSNQQQNDWSQDSNKLGEWKTELKDLGDLEPRFLKLFLERVTPGPAVPRSAVIAPFTTAGTTIIGRKKRRTLPRWPRRFWPSASNPALGRIHCRISVLRLAGAKAEPSRSFSRRKAKILSETGQWQLVDYLHRAKPLRGNRFRSCCRSSNCGRKTAIPA